MWWYFVLRLLVSSVSFYVGFLAGGWLMRRLLRRRKRRCDPALLDPTPPAEDITTARRDGFMFGAYNIGPALDPDRHGRLYNRAWREGCAAGCSFNRTPDGTDAEGWYYGFLAGVLGIVDPNPPFPAGNTAEYYHAWVGGYAAGDQYRWEQAEARADGASAFVVKC